MFGVSWSIPGACQHSAAALELFYLSQITISCAAPVLRLLIKKRNCFAASTGYCLGVKRMWSIHDDVNRPGKTFRRIARLTHCMKVACDMVDHSCPCIPVHVRARSWVKLLR